MADVLFEHIKGRERRQFDSAVKSTLKTQPIPDANYEYIDSNLDDYDKSLFGAESKNSILDLVKNRLTRNKGNISLLVLGCGSGGMPRSLCDRLDSNLVKRLRITEVGAADPRTPEEKEIDESYGIKFVAGDIGRINLGVNMYDLVISRLTMVHLMDPLRIIRKVNRALKIGGEFYSDFSTYEFRFQFRPDKNRSSETKLNIFLNNVRNSGIPLFIDSIGLYLKKKNSDKLDLNAVQYRKDEDGRIYYELTNL